MSAEKKEGGEAPAWKEFKAQGNTFYGSESYESAVQAYTKAIECDDIEDGDKATVLANRAQCRLMLKQYEKAVSDCTDCLALAEDNVKAMYRRATALENLGKKEEALADFRKVRELSPGVAGAAAGIRRLEAAIKGTTGAGFSDKRGAGRKVTKEDMIHLQELEGRVASVATQLKKNTELKKALMTGTRRLTLTKTEVDALAEDTNTYEAIGKMFMKASVADVKKNLDTKLAAQDKKLKAVDGTIEYLQKAQKEADSNWMEMVKGLRGGA